MGWPEFHGLVNRLIVLYVLRMVGENARHRPAHRVLTDFGPISTTPKGERTTTLKRYGNWNPMIQERRFAPAHAHTFFYFCSLSSFPLSVLVPIDAYLAAPLRLDFTYLDVYKNPCTFYPLVNHLHPHPVSRSTPLGSSLSTCLHVLPVPLYLTLPALSLHAPPVSSWAQR